MIARDLDEEAHAYGIALGQSAEEMRRGPCAYYIYTADEPPGDVTILQEELPPPDLAKLAKAAGLSKEEVAEMSEDELREAVAEEIGEALLGEQSDGFYKVAEAPTLLALVQRILEQDLMAPDLGGEDRPSDQLFSDAALDRRPDGGGLKEIKSLRLRRIASGLREGAPAGASSGGQAGSSSAPGRRRRPSTISPAASCERRRRGPAEASGGAEGISLAAVRASGLS